MSDTTEGDEVAVLWQQAAESWERVAEEADELIKHLKAVSDDLERMNAEGRAERARCAG